MLLDSYSAHWNKEFDNSIKNQQVNIKRMKIPKGTTALTQPLDTRFNHCLKFFIKKFNDRVKIDEIELNLKDRENYQNRHNFFGQIGPRYRAETV